MSATKCIQCGSTDIDTDPARGDTFCVQCGLVITENAIVSETAFEEGAGGSMVLSGHYVSNDSTGGGSGFGSSMINSSCIIRFITTRNKQ